MLEYEYTNRIVGGVMVNFIPHSLETLFLLFMIYSVSGWIIETISQSIILHKFVNRGFLLGPYCPVYGYGAVIMTVCLEKYADNILLLFVMAVIICSLLEYFTSFVMEKLFRTRWWDYSEKPFNLNGRICLSNCILFGIGGVLVIEIFNPYILSGFNNMPFFLNIITIILFIIFTFDTILSLIIVENISHEAKLEMKDSTVEISEKVRAAALELQQEVAVETGETINMITSLIVEFPKQITKSVIDTFNSRSYLYRRIINAYPDFQVKMPRLKKIRKEIRRLLKDNIK